MRPDKRPAQEIASDIIVRMQVRCIRAGFPFDVVDTLGENELLAFCVILGELDGGEFDWDSYEWREPPQAR